MSDFVFATPSFIDDDMDEITVKNLQEEMKSLERINIEADEGVSPSVLQDILETVKKITLDFASLARK